MTNATDIERARIFVKGIVQGIGFRPFIYKLAFKHDLKGFVYNTSEGVIIEAEGHKGNIDRFYNEILTNAPPLSRIENSTISYFPPQGYTTFEIRSSISEEGKYQLISPDIATCKDCLYELTDPGNRRYYYPFTNCTNCGPRFTLIEDIPYDRPFTTMKSFTMCPNCRKEYENPDNRRFHAQPNACPVCGPQIELLDASGNRLPNSNVIKAAATLLTEGKIFAIKGLGGFQLACDATNESSVRELRLRKKRESRPFALMVANLDEAKKYCHLSSLEENLLVSAQSPIVLVQRKPDIPICRLVAPGIEYLGLMLPYTPLHHLLLREAKLPLIMTSGNISEEPIARDNSEALERLMGIADYFLVHNRDIYSRYDDSVTMIERKEVQLIRRARGYAPSPIKLNFQSKPVLACGADEKNSFCLTRDRYAFVSQHIGDLENLETLENYEKTIDLYEKLFRINPYIIASDLHPDYASTSYAHDLVSSNGNMKAVPVQHHHAHIVSCMADNSIDTPVIGIAFDGTGYGSDGHLWGGEFLFADYHGFERLGHLEYLPLPGGEKAIKKPYRTAIGYLYKILGDTALQTKYSFLKEISRNEIDLIRHQVRTGLNTPVTSSIGRLFDAVSSICGIRGIIDYDGQAAIELEMTAYGAVGSITKGYPFAIREQDGTYIISISELLTTLIEDVSKNASISLVAAKFHHSIASMIFEMVQLISNKTGVTQVALSGGVFQNRLLLRLVIPELEKAGFSVLTHRQVPCNDGGISLGQAVIANLL